MSSGWTTYGKQQMLAVGSGAIARPTLYAALFSTSADPSTSPVELTLAGYSRQQINYSVISANVVGSATDVVWGPLASGSYQGIAIFDQASGGTPWAWADESAPVTIVASSNVTHVAGSLQLTLVP